MGSKRSSVAQSRATTRLLVVQAVLVGLCAIGPPALSQTVLERANGSSPSSRPSTTDARTKRTDPVLRVAASEAERRPEDGGKSSSSSDPPEGLQNGGVLQEVVVTARHKEEALTAVPASITAYSSDFLQQQNIQDFADYAMRIPNLTFQYGQGSSYSSTGFSGGRVTTIRGVAGAGTTAYYIDDTPVPETISPRLLDLERIEVLKGPQGTLYGASSMGGNLRFITRKPSLSSDSYTVQGQTGGTSGGSGPDADGQGIANVVLVPGKVALNVGLELSRDSGFITRRFPDPSGNLVSDGGQGENTIASGTIKLRYRVTDRFEATVDVLGQTSDLNGYPAAYVPLPAYRPVSYTLDRSRDVQEYSKDNWGLGSLVLNYSGNGFSIVSSTSYFDRQLSEKEDDTEGTNYYFENSVGVDLGDPALYFINNVSDKRLTEETRLTLDEGALLPRLSGIVGIFYQHLYDTFQNPPIPVPQLTEAGLYPGYVVGFRTPSYENDAAVFGEIYYKLLPKLTATLGAREYRVSKKTDSYVISGVLDPGGEVNPAVETTDTGLVPKAVLSYKVGDQGNVYVSASKGFRPGGTQVLPSFCDADLAALGYSPSQASQYKPDMLWSYEVGAKSRLENGRLSASAAAFQIDWSQIQQTIVLPTCTFTFTGNAGKARIRGGEFELSGVPLEQVPLSIELGVGYTDGTLLDPGLIAQAPDSPLTQVPTWTGTVSAYYERPISTTKSWFVAMNYGYTGSVRVDEAGTFVTRQPFSMLGANFGIQFGRSELMLYGKNLLNRRLNLGDLYAIGFERVDASGQLLPLAAVSRPLQLGIQYKVSFL